MLEATFESLLAVICLAILWFAFYAVKKLYQGQR